mgnify:CR=1 FL=1
MDLENIKQEYFQKGKKEQAIKCAQKLLEMEWSTSKVAWKTGLPLKEIRQRQRKNRNSEITFYVDRYHGDW